MIKKISKISLVAVLAFALVLGTAGAAQAALTFGATSAASSGILTLTGVGTGTTSAAAGIGLTAAGTSTIVIGGPDQTGAIDIGAPASSAISTINIGTNSPANVITIGSAASGTTIAGTLTLSGTLSDGASTLTSGVTNGTILTSIQLTPKASVAVGGITSGHKLVSFGDVTGNTAFGIGDVGVSTTGVMASFGRTAAATSGTLVDTGLDARMINSYNNSPTTLYTMQGAYIKAKNYSGGNVDVLKGLFVEGVNEGTATSSHVLYLGTDSTTLTDVINMSASKAAYGIDMSGATIGTAAIRLQNATTIASGTASPNGSVTAPKGSLYLETTTPALWQNTDSGTTWSAGSAPSPHPYAMFFGLTAGTGMSGTDYAGTIAVGAPVPFPQNGPTSASGIARVAGPSTISFTLPNTGTYEVTFNVHTTETGQLQLAFLSGGVYTAIDNTTAADANPTSGGHNIGGTYFVTATAGQVLAVINPAGNPIALTITPGTGATHAISQTLTIKQL